MLCGTRLTIELASRKQDFRGAFFFNVTQICKFPPKKLAPKLIIRCPFLWLGTSQGNTVGFLSLCGGHCDPATWRPSFLRCLLPPSGNWPIWSQPGSGVALGSQASLPSRAPFSSSTELPSSTPTPPCLLLSLLRTSLGGGQEKT